MLFDEKSDLLFRGQAVYILTDGAWLLSQLKLLNSFDPMFQADSFFFVLTLAVNLTGQQKINLEQIE